MRKRSIATRNVPAGLARPVVGEELVPRALLCVDPWRMGMTGCVELLPQAYDRPALRREDRTAYMRRDECELSPVGVYQWFLF